MAGGVDAIEISHALGRRPDEEGAGAAPAHGGGGAGGGRADYPLALVNGFRHEAVMACWRAA